MIVSQNNIIVATMHIQDFIQTVLIGIDKLLLDSECTQLLMKHTIVDECTQLHSVNKRYEMVIMIRLFKVKNARHDHLQDYRSVPVFSSP